MVSGQLGPPIAVSQQQRWQGGGLAVTTLLRSQEGAPTCLCSAAQLLQANRRCSCCWQRPGRAAGPGPGLSLLATACLTSACSMTSTPLSSPPGFEQPANVLSTPGLVQASRRRSCWCGATAWQGSWTWTRARQLWPRSRPSRSSRLCAACCVLMPGETCPALQFGLHFR